MSIEFVQLIPICQTYSYILSTVKSKYNFTNFLLLEVNNKNIN